MKTFLIYLAVLIGIINCVNAQTTINYEDLVQRLAADFETPGIAVAVMDNFEFEEFTYGVSNVESQAPITNKTLFNVASISKLVTAHAIMLLIDQGRINLDNPIEDYLKSWRFSNSQYDSKLVTIRRVLNHSAGLSTEFGPGFTKNDELISLVDILSGKSDKRKSLRIVTQPEEGHLYSNLGYGLLQLLVEDVSGNSFEKFVEQNVLMKLKMNASSFNDPLLINNKYELATPHDYRMQPLQQERFVVTAAAGLISNLTDLEQLLLEETKNQELLSKISFAQMHSTGNKETYGLGHMIHKNGNDTEFLGHTGLGMGWNSSFQFIPNSDDGIVVLTNGDNGYYIHNTMTCAWYYSQTGRRIESCKVAPDKKLNGIAWAMEVGYEEGQLTKMEFEQFESELGQSRKSLKAGEFERFLSELSTLKLKLEASINDSEIQSNLDTAFESAFAWMEMPWFKN